VTGLVNVDSTPILSAKISRAIVTSSKARKGICLGSPSVANQKKREKAIRTKAVMLIKKFVEGKEK